MGKCATVKYLGISEKHLRLVCFPYSLRSEAKDWLNAEDRDKYTTWDDLSKSFQARFFSPAKTARLRNDITQFI